MPKFNRIKTRYPGVYYIETAADRIYYIRYKRGGKLIEEKAGYATRDRVTAASASQVRSRRIAGEMANNERREAERRNKASYTIAMLFSAYRGGNAHLRSRSFIHAFGHLASVAGKRPAELCVFDVDRIRVEMKRAGKAPQTIKHALSLLRRIIRWGAAKGLCAPLGFEIEMPKFDNRRTEYLTDGQVMAFHDALDRYSREMIGGAEIRAIMLMALYTGMRRGAILKLLVDDVDMERGLVYLRDGKGRGEGAVEALPLNASAQEIIREWLDIRQANQSPYLFPGRDGGPRRSVRAAWLAVREMAGLPETFRFHGLRHAYASLLVSNGVDLGVVQKLLLHKSPAMTQRYAHFHPDYLRREAGKLDEIIKRAREEKVIDMKKEG